LPWRVFFFFFYCWRCNHRVLCTALMNFALAVRICPYSALPFRRCERCVEPSRSCSLSVSVPRASNERACRPRFLVAAIERLRFTEFIISLRSVACAAQCSITCAVLSVVSVRLQGSHWQCRLAYVTGGPNIAVFRCCACAATYDAHCVRIHAMLRRSCLERAA
jgi:hypothetical protein